MTTAVPESSSFHL
uniref:Uncharacterized protein n=1 Tax=Lepeophtheirus salmonis TaxID=72036 RepID=A0A0K2VHS4_LEPSM